MKVKVYINKEEIEYRNFVLKSDGYKIHLEFMEEYGSIQEHMQTYYQEVHVNHLKLIHRVDGPAIIRNLNQGDIFALDGRLYSKENWFDKLSSEQKKIAAFNL